MKRNIWLNHLLGALFAFSLSVSTVGCFVTGFNLEITSMGSLILFCGMLSLVCALLFRFKYGGRLLLCLSALAAVFLWQQGALWVQFQSLALNITTRYNHAYGWPVFGANAAGEVDLPLLVLAWWTAVSVSFHVCRRSHILTALPSVVLPLVVCLVVTDTVPDEIYLYLLILGTSLLLLTDWVRRNNPTQSISLTLRIVIPVAAALAMIFLLNPQSSYVNHAAEIQKEAVNWFQQLQSLTEDVTVNIGTDAASSQRVNLETVGPKSKLSYPVMRVTSPVGGTLYLRGQDYNTYSGSGWAASRSRSETFTPGGESVGQLTITTYGTRNLLYVPYYTTDTVQLYGGRAKNDENLTRYSYDLSLSPAAGLDDIDSQYTQLQVNTTLWANALARDITAGCETLEEKVRVIGNYVRNSASYDLNTPRMSADADDFAQWFLEESDTGYCVHFATAATVLLRAAGIPARYVEGYAVICRAGEAIVVTNQSAHAWAEYYDSDTDTWKVLEATPSDAISGTEPEPSLPAAPVDTEPPETRPETTRPDEAEETGPIPTAEVSEPTPQERTVELPGWTNTLFLVALALAALILQQKLRISRKRRHWNQGNPNEMALTRWKQSEELARALNIPLPEELEGLAQKAKFSQHTLTREELQQFEHFRRDTIRMFNELPLLRKWFLRWILAIG